MAITTRKTSWRTGLTIALYALQAANGAPQSATYPWVALGDSYAAGPGAGQGIDKSDPDQCWRNRNSYPSQLHARFASGLPSNELQFLACSGALSAGDPKKDKLVGPQIDSMRQDAQLVTLSIGGNDVGFVDLLKACVYFEGDCAGQQQTSMAKIEALPSSLRATWDKIFEKLPAGDDSRKVYQTLYGQFFNPTTEWCDDRRMDPLNPRRGPLIKKEVRQQVNTLTVALNDKIKSTMFEYAQEKLSNGKWKSNRIAFLDPDQRVYAEHRFCESSPENFRDDNIYFFNALRQDSTGAIVEGGVEKRGIPIPEAVGKAFHPKSVAHGKIADRLKQAIEKSTAMLSKPGVKPLRMENMDVYSEQFHW